MDLARKLQLAPGRLVAVLGAPADVDLGDLPVDPSATAVLAFVRMQADLEGEDADAAIAAARDDRLAWLAYPKGGALGTDLNRDRLAAAVTAPRRAAGAAGGDRRHLVGAALPPRLTARPSAGARLGSPRRPGCMRSDRMTPLRTDSACRRHIRLQAARASLREPVPDANLDGAPGPLAQLVARLVRNEKVRGSNPLGSTARRRAVPQGAALPHVRRASPVCCPHGQLLAIQRQQLSVRTAVATPAGSVSGTASGTQRRRIRPVLG